MQYQSALTRETRQSIGIRPFVSRIVAQWILSLLMATWPKGAGTKKKGAGMERSLRVRLRRQLMPARTSAKENRYGANRGRHLR